MKHITEERCRAVPGAGPWPSAELHRRRSRSADPSMMNRAVARLAEQLAAQPESDFIALDSASDFGSAALLDGRSERGAERASGMALASAAETDRPLSKVLSEYAITQAELARQRLFVERLTAVMPNTLRLFSRAEQRSLWINRHLGARRERRLDRPGCRTPQRDISLGLPVPHLKTPEQSGGFLWKYDS